MDTKIKVVVGQTIHQGWESATISRSIYSLAGSFDLSLSPVWDKIPDEYELYAGEECKVLVGDTVVITGFIDRVRQSLDSTKKSIQVEGRDKTADLVDCSYMPEDKKGVRCWEKISFKGIVEKLLTGFEITPKYEASTGNPFPTWGIAEESIFDNLSRAASLRQLLLTSSPDGELVVTKPGKIGGFAHINEKSGVLNAEQTDDYTDRFSLYQTRAQNYQALKASESNLKIIAESKDSDVKRRRPLLINQDGETETATAKLRTNWERDTRISRSNRLELTVLGWFDYLGNLWEINRVINVSLLAIGANGKYLITGTRMTLDQDGMKTTLECEGIRGVDIDPTLEKHEYNVKRVLEQEANARKEMPQ